VKLPPWATLREEMTLRGLSANTQRAYLRAISQLAQHYGRPDGAWANTRTRTSSQNAR